MINVIRASNLTKRFGGLIAVNDLELNLGQGEIVGIIGPNGSGKTTTLNLLTGFYRPSTGSIQYADRDLARLPAWRIAELGVARTFQTPVLFQHLTVLENVMVGCHKQGRSNWLISGLSFPSVRREEAQLREKAMLALESVGMADRAHEMPSALPFGLQRMVEIARIIAAEPKVLMLDEPASGLNQQERALLVQIIRNLRGKGLSVMLVEHDVALVRNLVNRIVVMAEGSKIADGEPAAVLAHERVITAYLGTAAVKTTRPEKLARGAHG